MLRLLTIIDDGNVIDNSIVYEEIDILDADLDDTDIVVLRKTNQVTPFLNESHIKLKYEKD